MSDRREGIAFRDQLQRAPGAEFRQRVAQRRVRIDERSPGQMQAHDLHQHLIGVRRPVERAGSRAVIRLGLGVQQLGPRRLALGEQLANLRLFVVGQARGHRPGGQEHGGQVAERERADQQAWHDLVADAEIDRRVEHLVRERHRRGKRDDVAREQGQLHARLALRDPVTHRGHAAGDLRGPSGRPHRALDQFGKALERLMRRKHVVVGRDDRQIRRLAVAQRVLVLGAAGGEAVREIGAAELLARRPLADRMIDPVEIGPPPIAAALDDALGDFADAGVEGRRHV